MEPVLAGGLAGAELLLAAAGYPATQEDGAEEEGCGGGEAETSGGGEPPILGHFPFGGQSGVDQHPVREGLAQDWGYGPGEASTTTIDSTVSFSITTVGASQE